MAKRNSKKKQTTSTATSSEAGALERQVLAFAEQLGYVAGSIESRTEGWMDREKLSRQVTDVRDGAKRLLAKLASGVTSRVQRAPAAKGKVARSRSGGTVDAPGKKHRKPAPAGPPAAAARARNTRVSGAAPRARAAGHRARQG